MDDEGDIPEMMAEEGGEEAGPLGKASNAFCMMCLGIFLFPLALFLLGWNEQNYVCTEKQILYAEANAETFECSNAEEALEKDAYFHCPLDATTFDQWYPASFNSGAMSGDIERALTFFSPVARQEVAMWQCRENKETKTENDKTVTIYTYDQVWHSARIPSENFATSSAAIQNRQRGCPNFDSSGGNPQWPTNLQQDTMEETQIGDPVKAGTFTVSKDLMEYLRADIVVALAQFASNFSDVSGIGNQYKPTLETTNSAIAGNQIVTCNPAQAPAYGCIKVNYYKSSATFVSVLAAIGSGGVTQPMKVSGSWGCSAGEFQRLEAKDVSLEDMIGNANDENKTTTWMLRIGGVLAAWLSVFCCLQPIAAAADIMGDCLNMIPCCGDFLENMLEGVVTTVLCFVSCGVGCACSLFVIALTWLFMRPLYGAIMLLVALCCCCAAGGGLHAYSSNKVDKRDVDIEYPEYSDG